MKKQSEIEKWAKTENMGNMIGGVYLLSVVAVWTYTGSYWLGVFWPFILIGKLI